MSKKRKQRPSERWRQRVDLVRSERSLEALARDFDRSAATIRKLGRAAPCLAQRAFLRQVFGQSTWNHWEPEDE